MNQLDRLYQFERLLRSRRALSRQELMDALEISRPTFTRYLALLRDRLHAPVVYDRDSNTYSMAPQTGTGTQARQELPGLWFSQEEIVALLTMCQLIGNLEPGGGLHQRLLPIQQRLDKMLASVHMQAGELQRRIRIIGVARRQVPARFFELVGLALTRRQQLRIRYYSRHRDETGERVLSPQRLVFHRHTWYLDAWCHTSESLRRFALDGISQAELLAAPVHDIPLAELESNLDQGFGIYTGPRLRWATLRFTPTSARWVAPEQWHRDQQSKMLRDGSLQLRVPYTHDSEILMEILRHGADVRVMAPRELRDEVRKQLATASDQYKSTIKKSTTTNERRV